MEWVTSGEQQNEVTCHAGNSYKVTLLPGDRLATLDVLRSKTDEMIQRGREDAFFVLDMGDVIEKYEKWRRLIPHVEPFYAVKCNPSPVVIKLLAHLGTGFDCASQSEIDLVLKLGVPPSRIVFANPCKQNSSIHFAACRGVEMMTFDSENELCKIKKAFPTSRLLLRILPPADYKKHGELGNKYGCHINDVKDLLLKAQQLDLLVIGISFNAGFGVLDPEAYSVSVEMAAAAFGIAESLGFHLTLLDIGGGFLGCTHQAKQFEKTAEVLNDALQKYFPPERNVRLISEPGTYFVASAYTLAVNVIGKKPESRHRTDQEKQHVPNGNGKWEFRYFLNDGIYGSFLNFHMVKTLQLNFIPVKITNGRLYKCSLWGPTCDGLDLVQSEAHLPELNVGDYLCVYNMGYYTISLYCGFNGMPCPEVFLYCAENIWSRTFPKETFPSLRQRE